MRLKGFEVVSVPKIRGVETKLPYHGSERSAGFDFFSKESVVIRSGFKHKFITDIKAYMLPDEYLKIVVRSSIGMKKGLELTSQVGIIDSDFYNNPENEGNISIELKNDTKEDVFIEKGERIAQGIFKKFLMADEGTYSVPENYKRSGGIGSTN